MAMLNNQRVPSGKRLHNYGKIHHFIAGQIVSLPEGNNGIHENIPLLNNSMKLKLLIIAWIRDIIADN